METTTLNPQYIYVQATTPSDKTEGKLWYNTTASALYSSDGTNYKTMETDVSKIYQLIGQNGLNILDNTAQATLTAGTNANFIRDIYTDSTGYLNTIDTGNTTATFDTDKYINSLTANYSQTFDVSAQDTSPEGLTFNSTGTKMYVIGDANNSVYEYDLSTAWDISTATYSQTFSIATQDISPKGVAFNSTGTKMYVLGDANDSVYEYDLSTAWDISTATYSQTFDVSAQDTTLEGVAFNSTGTKMYVIGNDNNSVYEYDLSISNKIAQTNAQTIASGYTNFMIVSSNETTSGTGTIDYDISFNGGTNEQTSLSPFTEYSITDAGISLILKQKLNAGESEGSAEATNYGVLLW